MLRLASIYDAPQYLYNEIQLIGFDKNLFLRDSIDVLYGEIGIHQII